MKQTIYGPMLKWQVIIVFVITFTSHGIGLTGDGEVCSDHLKEIKQAAAAATDFEAKAAGAKDKFDTIKGQMQNCIRNPDQFDPHQDQCDSLLKEWKVAKSAYDSVMAKLNHELNNILRYTQAAKQSCQKTESTDAAAIPAKQQPNGAQADRKTAPLKNSQTEKNTSRTPKKRGSYSSAELEFCMRTMTETECRKRFDIK